MCEHRSEDWVNQARSCSAGVGSRTIRMRSSLALCIAVCLALIPVRVAADPPITAAAFTPDGNGVIVGSQAGLRMFSWPSLIDPVPLSTQLENIHHVAFSPNGQRLLISGGVPGESGAIEIQNWPDRVLQSTIRLHNDVISQASWSPDGASIATASADGLCKVLNAETGQIRTQFSGHSRPVLAVEYLDAYYCISGSVDQTIRLWKVSDGGLLRTLNNHVNTVNRLARQGPAAERNRDRIASISDDRTVRIWQPGIGRLVRFVRLPSEPQCVVWSSDFKLLYVATKASMIYTIDVATMKVTAEQMTTIGFLHELLLDSERQLMLAAGEHGIQRIEIAKMKGLK
jgi:WD40 repeat protein